MFLVFYTVKIVYICVLMTCSTTYYFCDTIMDPWNVVYIYIYIYIITIQPLGLFGRNQSPVRRPAWLWHAAFLGMFLGVVFHCFPLPLYVPTFAAKYLHVPINASAPSSERWNCG
jgi:uncharacterized membrane protein